LRLERLSVESRCREALAHPNGPGRRRHQHLCPCQRPLGKFNAHLADAIDDIIVIVVRIVGGTNYITRALAMGVNFLAEVPDIDITAK
jgi:hypothetical protein